MSLTRRHFIRNMLAAPLMGNALLNNSAVAAINTAQATAAALGKTLVVIFQRGGCDGLNTVVPYGDADYYSARGGTIAIPPPEEGTRSALDLDGFFGLHPSMSAMQEIFQAGDMAIMPAVSWENTNRSHFENQAAIESGGKFLSSQGWLNLHLQNQQRDVALRALNFGGLAQAMRGDFTVSTVSNLSKRGLGESYDADIKSFLNDDLLKHMNTSYDLSNIAGTSRDLLYTHGRKLLDDIDVLGGIDPASYQVENSANYPNSGLGTDLKNAAQLIKANLGVEVVSISSGGWDTHSNQGGAEENGAHAKKLADFSNSIGAFYKDMGDNMSDVMILTMSEFGRSLNVSASNGTDHGHAAAWFVIGQAVNGGIYGDWPGLSVDQLNHGRYLSETIDFRDIMGEVLINHLSNANIDQVLPGFNNYQSVGFL